DATRPRPRKKAVDERWISRTPLLDFKFHNLWFLIGGLRGYAEPAATQEVRRARPPQLPPAARRPAQKKFFKRAGPCTEIQAFSGSAWKTHVLDGASKIAEIRNCSESRRRLWRSRL